MANSSWAAIDNNDKPTLTAVTDDSNQYIQRVLVDPASGRLLVSATGLGATLTLQTNGTNNGSQSLLNLVAGTNMTITDNGSGSITFASTGGSSGITVNTTTITGGTTGQLVYDNGGTFGELTTATYPSLTELSYVKGVTSAIQTQINAKGAGTVTAIGVTTANGVSGSSSGGATPNLTITLGAITPSTVNGNTISTGTGTLTLSSYTLTASATGTVYSTGNPQTSVSGNAGTVTNATLTTALTVNTGAVTLIGNASGSSITFPSGSSTMARTDTAQTFIGKQTFANTILTANAITASGNAATIPVTSGRNIVTNNSAATLTITMTTTSAVNMQTCIVQILDASAVAQTIAWVNTENSLSTVPLTTNGSTTAPLSVVFQYNSLTSLWRCLGIS